MADTKKIKGKYLSIPFQKNQITKEDMKRRRRNEQRY